MVHLTRTTQTQKKTVPHKTKTKQKRKKEMYIKGMTKKECTLQAEVLLDLNHGSTHFHIFQTATGINELLEIIVTETDTLHKKVSIFKQWRMKGRHSLG